jgi:hypothetical protein
VIMLVFLAVSVAVGYLRGGRLANYLEDPLRGVFLPIAAFGLEMLLNPIRRVLPWPSEQWLWIAVSAEYLLIFIFVFLNRRRRSFWVVAIASVLNFAVIALNGFRMPISPVVHDYAIFENIVERVSAGKMVEYVLVGYDAPLWWLGDTIPVLWVVPGLASVGDIGIALGMFLLMQEIMCPRRAEQSA